VNFVGKKDFSPSRLYYYQELKKIQVKLKQNGVKFYVK